MHNYNKKLLLNSEIIKRKLPDNVSKYDYKIFKEDLKKKFNKVYYYEINNFNFFNNNYFDINSKKILFDFLQIENISNFRFIKKIILLIFFYLKKFIKLIDKKEEIEKGIIIHNRQSSGYFHWVNDILPKITIIKKLKKFDKYPIILPENLKSNFHFESLKLLNMNFIKQKKNLTIKKAIYIPDLSPSGSPRPKILKLFSDKLKKFSKEKKLQKIYISRRKSRRKIVNENQLIKILLKHNFKIYFMEDLKFIDQISICNSAKVLIGLHGAGLTNSMWMKKNSILLEIRPRNEFNLNCYFALANILKLKYYYFFCKKKTFFKSVTNSNYFLDTIRFKKEFYNILKL